VNFMGRYIYVADGAKGLDAVVATEHDEPPAVFGSYLQRLAYPDDYKRYVAGDRELKEAYHHEGNVLDVQLRGEYLYTATGKGGLRIYDMADIDNKGFSERITTAPVSPLGQRFYVKTKYAMAVASPSTAAVDPARAQHPENEEQPIHPLYAFLYVADKYEGLVVVGDPNVKGKSPGVSTLLDGDPRFVLSASGHIQALVNPPSEESRSSYQVGEAYPESPEAWSELAATRRGSWWPDYDEWLSARSGELRPAPKRLGGPGYRAHGKAPGTYVHDS